MPRDWDAATYDALPIPMTAWGREVVDRMVLRGTERVLDAGCGTGQVTAYLRERLPLGRIVALDGSTSMLERARERLGVDRVSYVHADLMAPLPIEAVDAIVSTATFHWIADHDRLFANLARVLRPGGRLTAQCGGSGNIANVTAILASMGHDVERGKVFPGPDETADRLGRAGFLDVECSLRERPVTIPREDLERYLRTVCMGGLIDDLPVAEAEALVRRVAEATPEPRIDYVRLDIDAVRAA